MNVCSFDPRLCRAPAAFLGLLVAALLTATAEAHGIGDSARDKSVVEFVPLGIEHMLLGWDHLLFIAGVLLLSGGLRRAAKLISLFVAGHSLTLLTATLAGWQLDATLVDVVIALSVVYVGARGLRGAPDDWRAVSGAIFAFGLIHGLGLSTRLQHIGLPDDGLFWRVIAFNVGVEIGQLGALLVMIGVGALVAGQLRQPSVSRAAFGSLLAAGLIAAAVLSFPDPADDGATARADALFSDDCEAREIGPPPRVAAGGHPPKLFFEPRETVPDEDLFHVVGDGYLIVRYRPDLPASERRALAAWIEATRGVIGAPLETQSEPLRVFTRSRLLSCSTFRLADAQTFQRQWLADVRAGRAQ